MIRFLLIVLVLLSCGSRKVEKQSSETSVKAKVENAISETAKVKTETNEVSFTKIENAISSVEIEPIADSDCKEEIRYIYKDKTIAIPKGYKVRLTSDNSQTTNKNNIATTTTKEENKAIKTTENKEVKTIDKAKKVERKESTFWQGVTVGILLSALVYLIKRIGFKNIL